MVDAVEPKKWLFCELAGYPINDPTVDEYMGRMGRGIDTYGGAAYREPLAQIEANITAMKLQMQALRVPDISYTSANSNNTPVFDQEVIAGPVNSVLSKATYLSNSIAQLSG